MRSLYTKILGWLLGTVILSLCAFIVMARSAADENVKRQGNPFAKMAALQLSDLREAYETRGAAGLAKYIAKLNRIMEGEHYLLDESGKDLVNGEDRRELLAQATPPGFRPVPKTGRVILVRTADDGKYHFVAIMSPPFSPWTFAPYFLLVLGLAALLCWVLAITIASPLRKMATVVDTFGAGDLTARLHSRRSDEIGDLARAFDKMADRIQTLMTAERRLLQDVSHELRSPLARLSFAAELVKTAQDRNLAVARLQKEIARLTELVSGLIVVTRAEGDPVAHRSEPIALCEVVREITEDCRVEAAARDCQLSVELPGGVEVPGDPELLRRAIENVVRNAIRYSPQGAVVEVRVTNDERRAQVTVRDHGPGVPEDVLGKIFSPFFRVDESRNNDTGGVGLGLAIASRAVQLHNGAIQAANSNPGLLVTIQLPVYTSAVLA